MRQSKRVADAFAEAEHHLRSARAFLDRGDAHQAKSHALELTRSSAWLVAELARVSDRQRWPRV